MIRIAALLTLLAAAICLCDAHRPHRPTGAVIADDDDADYDAFAWGAAEPEPEVLPAVTRYNKVVLREDRSCTKFSTKVFAAKTRMSFKCAYANDGACTFRLFVFFSKENVVVPQGKTVSIERSWWGARAKVCMDPALYHVGTVWTN